MYLGIDVHKRHAQVAVLDEAGEIVEVRVLAAVSGRLAGRTSHSYRTRYLPPAADRGWYQSAVW